MPIPPWVEFGLALLAFFVVVPAIAVAIGHAAWVGKPKRWDRSMYWTAFVATTAAALFLGVYAKRMDADVGTWRYSAQLVLLGLAVLLFGVAFGCGVGTLTYGRGKGPTWRPAAPGAEHPTDSMESDQHLDG